MKSKLSDYSVTFKNIIIGLISLKHENHFFRVLW
jgi:hypothetical protein